MTTQSIIVGTAEILSMTNVSRSTFYRVCLTDPTFPKPFKIGLRKNAWYRASVEAWITTRAAFLTDVDAYLAARQAGVAA